MADKSGDGEPTHPDNKKLSGEGWTGLRERKRGCTDCLCLLLLIAAWIAMTAVGLVACGLVKNGNLKAGNPNRLIAPSDYKGRLCGFSDGVKDRKNGYYLPSGASVCVESCPHETDYLSYICYDEYQEDADGNDVTAWEYIGQLKCMYKAKTKAVLRHCAYIVDKAAENATAIVGEYLAQGEDIPYYADIAENSPTWSASFFSDLYTLRGYIFGFGVGVAVFFAFGFLYFLRIPGVLFTIIWTLLLSVFVLFIVGSFLLFSLSNTWKNDGNHTKAEYMSIRITSYVGFALTGLYLCFLVVMRKRIMLAIGIVKETARAMAAMPIILFLPILQAIGIVIFLVPWTIYVLFLASSGEQHFVDVGGGVGYQEMKYDNNTRYAFLYMLFCYFWSSEFIVAIGQLVIALSFSAFYFTRDKKTEGNKTVFWALRTTLLYHLGTAAFGSLIIAIIKTIRAVLTYLQNKAKKSGNKVAEYILCCLNCCMWCVEKFMKFINKNGYIQTAIYGYSFCKACRAAFFLLARNILRVIAVSMVGDFVLLLGKVFVPLVTVFACYLFMAYVVSSTSIYGIIAPLICVFLLSYFIAAMFTEIFGMGISTTLMCYVADEEMFPPQDRFADGDLKNAIQKSQQTAVAAKVIPSNIVVIQVAGEPNAPSNDNGNKDNVLL